MKKVNRLVLTAFCLVLAMTATLLVACGKITVTLNKSVVTIGQFETYQLTAEVEGTKEKVTWSSSDSTVAAVDQNGLVTASNAGTATIKAVVGDVEATCEVTVEAASALPSLDLSKAIVTVKKGKTETVTASVKYKAADITSDVTIAWESDKTDVVTVANGVITGVSKGTASIKVTADYMGYKIERPISVTVEENVSMTISEDEIIVYTANPDELDTIVTFVDLSVEIFEDDAKVASPTVQWSVDTAGAEYVNVTNGKVTATKGGGSATVTASWVSSLGGTFTASCDVITSLPTVSREGNADIDLSEVAPTLDLSKYTGLGTLTDFKLYDKESKKEIVFTKAGDILSLEKANLVRGVHTYEVNTGAAIYEIEATVADKILKTAQDIVDIKTFGTVTKEKIYVDSKDREDWDKNKELFAFEAYYILGNDIDLSGKVIGTDFTIEYGDDFYFQDFGFNGTFDGRGYTIYGGEYKRGGLFGYVSRKSVIKNIAFTRASISGPFSGLMGVTFCGKLENVLMDVYKSDGGLSGVLGYANGDLTMKNCVIYCDENKDPAIDNDRAITGLNANTGTGGYGKIVLENTYVISNLALSSSDSAGLSTDLKYAFGTKCADIQFKDLDAKYWVTDGNVVMFKNWVDYGKAELAKLSGTADVNSIEALAVNFALGDIKLEVVSIADEYKDLVKITGTTISLEGTSEAIFDFTVDVIWNGYVAAKKTVTVSATVYEGVEVEGVLEYELYTGLDAENKRVANATGLEIDLTAQSVTFATPKAWVLDKNGNRTTLGITATGSVATVTFPDGINGGEYTVEIVNGTDLYIVDVTLWNRILTTVKDVKNLVAYGDDVSTIDGQQFGAYYEDTTIYIYSGYFKLGANIDLGSEMIGNGSPAEALEWRCTGFGFHGLFDGNGYTLSRGIYTQGGIFGIVSTEGVVKNLAVVGATLHEKSFSSVIAGSFFGKMDNVLVKVATVQAPQENHNGLTARGIFGLFIGTAAEISNSIFYLDGEENMLVASGGGDGVFSHYASADATYTNVYVFTDYLNAGNKLGVWAVNGAEDVTGITTKAYATDITTLSLEGFDGDIWNLTGAKAEFETNIVDEDIVMTMSQTEATIYTANPNNEDGIVTFIDLSVAILDDGTAVDSPAVVWTINSAGAKYVAISAEGKVTATKGEGSATITAMWISISGVAYKATCTVTTKAVSIKVEGTLEYELYTSLDTESKRVANAVGLEVDLSSISVTFDSPSAVAVDKDDNSTVVEITATDSVATVTFPAGVKGGAYTLEILNGDNFLYVVKVTLWNRVITDKEAVKTLIEYSDDVTTAINTHWSKSQFTDNTIYDYYGYFKLGADINLGDDIVGRGTPPELHHPEIGFHGIFDGDGYTLTGGVYTSGGIFGMVSTDSVVKNLAIKGATIHHKSYSAVIANLFCGTLDNVLVEVTTVQAATDTSCTARGVFGLFIGDAGKLSNSIFYLDNTAGNMFVHTGAGDGVFSHYASGTATYNNIHVFTNFTNGNSKLGVWAANGAEDVTGITSADYATDISTLTLDGFDSNLWDFTGTKAAFKAKA